MDNFQEHPGYGEITYAVPIKAWNKLVAKKLAYEAENEQLKKLLAEVKAEIETAKLGEGYEYNLRLILEKIKALKECK